MDPYGALYLYPSLTFVSFRLLTASEQMELLPYLHHTESCTSIESKRAALLESGRSVIHAFLIPNICFSPKWGGCHGQKTDCDVLRLDARDPYSNKT